MSVDNIIRLPETRRRTGLSRSTIYRKMARGIFPSSVPLGENVNGDVCAVGWYESEINAWVADPSGWRAAEGGSE